jgi:Ca2+-binding EF-hand superfamily protein
MPNTTRTAKLGARWRCVALLWMSAMLVGACAKRAAPPVVNAPLVQSPAAEASQANEASEPAAATDAQAPADEGPVAAPARAERLVLFTPRGPLIVHLEISIEGQPQYLAVEQVLQEAARAAGAKGDEDPTWDELMASPRIASGQFGNAAINGPAERQRLSKQFDLNRDGRAQRNELAAFLAQDIADGRAFAVRAVNEFRGGFKQDSPLFVLLDEDQDGQLSAAEMSAATVRLRSRDADDDDVVSLADFRPRTVGEVTTRRGGRRLGRAVELNKLEVDSIYYTLCELYNGENGLDAASFALTPSLLARLDSDRNGKVDQQEIVALVDARPDLLLKVSFGPASSGERQPTIELAQMSDDLVAAGAAAHPASGRLNVALAGFDLDVSVDDLATDAGPLAAATARFAMLDADKNGVLEGEELKAAGLDLSEVDENGDGKLSLEEIQEAAGKQRRYGWVQVQARVGEADDPLFSWLDLNHDDRLTLREMQGAAGRLGQLDADGDGVVSAAEIPDRLTCTIVRGAPANDAAPRGPARPRGNPNAQAKSPRWLTAMDTNGDGEISLREFLGTAEQFEKLDVNGDGFLDTSEAQQAESSH